MQYYIVYRAIFYPQNMYQLMSLSNSAETVVSNLFVDQMKKTLTKHCTMHLYFVHACQLTKLCRIQINNVN